MDAERGREKGERKRGEGKDHSRRERPGEGRELPEGGQTRRLSDEYRLSDLERYSGR